MAWIALAFAVLPTGCAGTPPAVPPAKASAAAFRVPSKSYPLLYVSTYGGPIYALRYPQGNVVGTLDGYTYPAGLCSDASGNVFITYPFSQLILEYAHGASVPMQTLSDPEQSPIGCAVDARNGDLAVASTVGSLQIYKHGSGIPQTYKYSGIELFLYCTYDKSGDLFADGVTQNGDFSLVEMEKGSDILYSISVGAAIKPYSSIQSQGKDLAIQASQGSGEMVIDRVEISNLIGTVVGTTTLQTSSQSSGAFFIYGGRVLVPQNGGVGLWKYPAGGSAIRTYPFSSNDVLDGVTISAARR